MKKISVKVKKSPKLWRRGKRSPKMGEEYIRYFQGSWRRILVRLNPNESFYKHGTFAFRVKNKGAK